MRTLLGARQLAGAAALACCAAVLPAAASSSPPAPAAEVVADVTASTASLGNGVVTRRWALRPDGTVVTTALVDEARHRNWSGPASPDFALTVDGVATSSTSGWQLAQVVAEPVPADPARPGLHGGAQLRFRYLRDVAGSSVVPVARLELDRVVVLRPHSAVLEVTSTLVADAARAARVSSYSLDEVTTGPVALAEVQAYHGGSDWRDDYRVPTVEKGAFDDEGETVRTDDGHGAGLLLVTERRSGVASRVGRDVAGRTWAGVDLARDLFDYGPLKTDAPDYNRLDNPAYPVPVRARLVRPGDALRLGRAFTGVYSGGAAEAGFVFGDHFAHWVMPAFDRSIGLNSFHPWNHGPGMSDPNLRPQVLLAKEVGVETFMLDDQWQGGPGGESGDWQFDPERFPDADHDGLPDFLAFLRGHGMKLGLWMSPAEFHTESTTYAAHPDWACAPTGDVTAQVPDDAGLGVWDVTNPQLRDHLTAVVDRAVTTWGATELKFDFQAWVDCGSHDYLDYEDAFLSLVRSFEARHPQVTFELDETNDQRAWPFESAAVGPSWFDNGHLHGSTAQAKLLHDLWTAAPWLPTSSIGMGFLDGTLDATHSAGFLAPLGLLSHLTFWTDQTKIPAAARTEVAFWTAWYADHRADLAGGAYELTTTDPLDGKAPMVLEPWHGDHGEVFAFWQSTASPLTVPVRGVEATRHYRVTDVRTGRVVRTATGAQLRQGLRLVPTGPQSAQVLTIDPVHT